MQPEDDIQNLVDAALEVAARRKVLLGAMRKALETGDEAAALQFARKLCGLENEEGGKDNSRIN